MRAALVGVGQAGGKLTRAIVEQDGRFGPDTVVGAVAVNTAQADLEPLPLRTLLVGQSRVNGHGVGGDNELGAEVLREDRAEVLDALDGIVTAETEAILVVAGLGGGTGSGGAPVICRALREVYDIPVYVLGILPGRDEGAMYQVNAGRSLKTVTREADATVLVDNDAFRTSGESVEEGFASINGEIARRVGLLLAAGEVDSDGAVGESVVDTSEVINTLRAGGIAAVGYASAVASEDAGENVNVVTSVVRRAIRTGMSLPGATQAESGLVVVAGRPERVPRKGVERARRWVEDETGSMQVRGGDYPVESDHVAALVLLGGIERSERVAAFVDRAREAAAAADEEGVDPATAFETEEIDDLF
ncbi:MAG: tubulin/FtsZ family protein [Halobacteriaceae archaeon]